MLQGDGASPMRARDLRRKMTLPEVLLWQRLRWRPAGLKFRRQHPAGPYVLDFYCHEARLIVEVDGMAHDSEEAAMHDNGRDAALTAKGLRVFRIAAADVLRDADGAAADIIRLGTATRAGEDS